MPRDPQKSASIRRKSRYELPRSRENAGKADERPIRFQPGNHEYFVEEVVDQWYGPDDSFFKVRASDGNEYVLRRRVSTPEGEWSLEAFRDHTMRGLPVL
jgi:hypothetical protein